MIYRKLSILHEWKEENLSPFDELMMTWNTPRPIEGDIHFTVSAKLDEWTPFLTYASWGSEGQTGYHSKSEAAPVRVYQDAFEVLEGKRATGFHIKVTSDHGPIQKLHVYTNGSQPVDLKPSYTPFNSIRLEVPGISQMTLNHPRHRDLCSPTSTAAISRYLSGNHAIHPVDFALRVWDAGFDIFGNWVFNAAESWTYLGDEWNCWVERLDSFGSLYSYLIEGSPVIVSVRGPLPGSAQPYAHGHLLVVTGYDSTQRKVLCMDPGFPDDTETHTGYHISDFIAAWGRRGNIAYLFKQVAKIQLTE